MKNNNYNQYCLWICLPSQRFSSWAASARLKHESRAVGRWFRSVVLWTCFVFHSRAQGGFILRRAFQWHIASYESLKEHQQKLNACQICYIDYIIFTKSTKWKPELLSGCFFGCLDDFISVWEIWVSCFSWTQSKIIGYDWWYSARSGTKSLSDVFLIGSSSNPITLGPCDMKCFCL